ncbi:helix-turn-helix transcriptional regulator [Echinicola sediminis]
MEKSPLPVYRIQDFDDAKTRELDFYYSKFSRHLVKHQFIQQPHKHDFYIVLLLTQGTGSHTIDFTTYTVGPGSVFFLSPGQVHCWELSKDSEGHILFFSKAFYVEYFSPKKLWTYSFFNSSRNPPFMQLNEQEAISIEKGFKSIKDACLEESWMKNDLIRNHTDSLLIQLHRNYLEADQVKVNGSPDQAAMQKLERLIEKHLTEHQPVSFYAEKMKLSQRQLSDLCKRTQKSAFTEIVRERLVLEAKRLLTHSELTIGELAAELGFMDHSYFIRFFKKNTGMTPEQFRKQL